MGNCLEKTDIQKSASGGIDKKLRDEANSDLRNFRILILGTGESGKSTLTRHIRLINNHGVGDNEKDTALINLQENVMDCMKCLIDAYEKYLEKNSGNTQSFPEIEIKNTSSIVNESHKLTSTSVSYNMDKREDIKKFPIYDIIKKWSKRDPFTLEMAVQIKQLFQTESIKHIYEKRSKFWILDACLYYINNCDKYCKNSSKNLSEEDILHARIRTTGVQEYNIAPPDFKNEEGKQLNIKLIDVGGQKSERKKWESCFSEIDSIFFVVNLNSYNQVSFEDTSNKLLDSVKEFEKLCKNPIFKETDIVLWFTKKDQIIKELERVPIDKVLDQKKERVFPDFDKEKYIKDIHTGSPENNIRVIKKSMDNAEILTSPSANIPYRTVVISSSGEPKSGGLAIDSKVSNVNKESDQNKSYIDYITEKFTSIRKDTQGETSFMINCINRENIRQSFIILCEKLKNKYNQEYLIKKDLLDRRIGTLS